MHGLPIYSFRNPINSWMLMDLSWIFPSFSICFRHRHRCNPLQWPLCSSSLKVSTARCQHRALAMPCSSPLQVCLAWSHGTQGKSNRKLRGVMMGYDNINCICLVSQLSFHTCFRNHQVRILKHLENSWAQVGVHHSDVPFDISLIWS